MDFPPLLKAKHPAMGCEFELILYGRELSYLRDAAAEAFEELDHLEHQLSFFISSSEISYINANAFSMPIRVEPRLFSLLMTASDIFTETGGAFDITVGALTDLWCSSTDVLPTTNEIKLAMQRTGMSKVLLDPAECTIRFLQEGIQINLGGIGKGYAIQRIANLLRDRGVINGLLSAGNSTIYAMGHPPRDNAWTVGISDPTRHIQRLGYVKLRDSALSVSGSHERYIEIGGQRYSHIIDPRTGKPVDELLAVAVVTDDPTIADALSTALFVLGLEQAKQYCDRHPKVSALIVSKCELSTEPSVTCCGRNCNFINFA
jgi:thiamine biosynthesis lipoprotein